MNPFAKMLVFAGVALIVAGLLWQFGSRAGSGLGIGKLPGDISINKPGVKFYFPLTTCLLISGAISLVMWIFNRFFK